ERDHLRPEILRQSLEPPGGAGKVAAAKIAASSRRPIGGVREAVAEVEQLPLLLRYEEPGREVRVSEEPPEVVARIREVRRSGSRAKSWVDPAEDAAQAETAVRTIKNYIGGGWVDAQASKSLDVTNPASGETLAQLPISSQADLDRAV